MLSQAHIGAVGTSAFLLILLEGMGCASQSDFYQLKDAFDLGMHSTAKDMSTLRGTLEAERAKNNERSAKLEGEVKELREKAEVLADELITQTTEAKKRMDELNGRRTSDMDAIHTELEGLKRERQEFTKSAQRLEGLTYR